MCPDWPSWPARGCFRSEARTLLGPDEALLQFYVGEDGGYVWAVTSEGTTWRAFSPGAVELDRTVGELRGGLDPLAPDRRVFDLAAAHELHEALLGGVASAIKGKRRLLVVPAGALQSLPLGVLVVTPPLPAPDEAEAHRRADWLIRHHSLLTLPSVGSLAERRVPSAPAPDPFIGFGDPLLEGGPRGARGRPVSDLRGVADVAQVRRIGRLPDTADEIKALASAAGAGADAVLLGPDATETRRKRLNAEGVLETRRVVAFATHGLVADGDLALNEPALVLTPSERGSALDDGLSASPNRRRQQLGGLVRAGWKHELVVEGGDAPIQFVPLGAHVVDQQPGARAERDLPRGQENSEVRFQLAPSLGHNDAVFRQKGAQLADQRRRLSHQPVAGAMRALRVELRLVLQRHEPHDRPCCELGDRFRVPIVVLLRLDVRAHILGRHQSDLVALVAEPAVKMMGAATGFHCHDAGRQPSRKLDHVVPVQPSAQNDTSIASSPTTMQLFLPRSIPSTAIRIGPTAYPSSCPSA